MVITNSLLTTTRDDIKTALATTLTYGGVGQDTTTALVTNTTLGEEVYRKAIDVFDSSVVNKITASLRILTTEANGSSIGEQGWLNANFSLADGCDAITGWTDSADMTVTLDNTTFLEGSGSISLTKDGTGSATASTSKTTTSVNFTTYPQVYMWIYVLDATALAKLATTDCFTLRFGTDGSNYYQFTKDAANFAVGWNYVGFVVADADSTTGTPTPATMAYTYVGLTATGSGITWSAGDILMDNINVKGGTMYVRNTIVPITKTDDIQVYFDTTITITVTES